MLAGPVAIGAPLLMVGPWAAILIGILAGVISALSFIYLQPVLCKTLGALDVMGVHNLHGMAGWFGAFVAAILLAITVGVTAALINLAAAVFVFAATLILGAVVGFIMKAIRGGFPDDKLFSDDADFIKSEAP
jgi:ammonium transporter Rh